MVGVVHYFATFVTVAAAFTPHGPSPSTWSRTKCGSPAGTHGPVPPGPYTVGLDRPGNDLKPCGSHGCNQPPSATHLECATKCNATTNCVAYVFAPANCSGAPDASICWLKSQSGGHGVKATCRNSKTIGSTGERRCRHPFEMGGRGLLGNHATGGVSSTPNGPRGARAPHRRHRPVA